LASLSWPGDNLPAYVKFFQFLFNHRHLSAFGRSQLVIRCALQESSQQFTQAWQWLIEARATPCTPHLQYERFD